MSSQANDPRRPDKIKRYKSSYSLQFSDDQLQEYMNVIGMVLSMCGLMMKVKFRYSIFKKVQIKIFYFKIKWCAWLSVLCSFVGFANAKSGDDTKQVLSCFMLSVSAVVMSYLQNPAPMNLPFS